MRIRRVAGPRPASEEGKPELTTAPWSQDHGDGNSGRLPFRTAVEVVPQEALKQVVPPSSVRPTRSVVTGLSSSDSRFAQHLSRVRPL
jgi:hypothetical protein